jgi:hypothetical protein
MAKFLFVYRNASNACAMKTPEALQLGMQKWREWITEGIQKGWLVDPGDALQEGGRVIKAPRVVTDGPFVEAKEVVGGFSIVEAATIDAATELAITCPVLHFGASVEVRCLAEFTARSRGEK